MRGKRSPLEWSSRVSIRGRWTLIGVGYKLRKVAFHNYREDPAILGPIGGAAVAI
jgi:hypothetical protein